MSARAIATCNFRQQSSEIAYLHVGVRLYLHPSRSLAHYCLQIGSAVAGFSFAFASSFLPPTKSRSNKNNEGAKELSNQWRPATIKTATSFPSWRINR